MKHDKLCYCGHPEYTHQGDAEICAIDGCACLKFKEWYTVKNR